jgi:hypothetical protein
MKKIEVPTAHEVRTYGVNALYMQKLFSEIVDAGFTVVMGDEEQTQVWKSDEFICAVPYPEGDLAILSDMVQTYINNHRVVETVTTVTDGPPIFVQAEVQYDD